MSYESSRRRAVRVRACLGTLRDTNSPDFQGWNFSRVVELCGSPVPSLDPNDLMVTAAAVSAWCDACIHPITEDIDPASLASVMQDNLAVMGVFDHVAMVFCALITALNVVEELKDIMLVRFAIEKAGNDDARLSSKWRWAFWLLECLRRFAFLPILTICIPTLVLVVGSDTVSVCLNTVAILFLSQIDNVLFAVLLPEPARARVEERGHVELQGTELRQLAQTKMVHTVLVTVMLLVLVQLIGHTGLKNPMILAWPILLCGAISDVLVPEAHATTSKQTARRVGQACGACLIGLIVCGMILVLMPAGTGV